MKKLALILLTITMTSFARVVNVSVNAYDDCKSLDEKCICSNSKLPGKCGFGSDHGGSSLYCQCY